MILRCAWLAAGVALATQAQAHDSKPPQSDAVAQTAGILAPETLPLPFDVGGPFALIDQHGQTRTEVDPAGHLQLVFFGYASCREICSAALPQMAEVADGLGARGIALTPVFITVDPTRDTVGNLGPAMAKYGPNFIGLTGDDAALHATYKAFAIDSSLVFEDPFYGPVYAHGSFLYLLDAKGGFLTVIPPILSTDRVIDLIAGYAPQG